MKTVVITGGNRGIGLGITRAFLDAGYDVFVGARSEGEIKSFQDANLVYIPTDVRKEVDVEKLVSVAVSESGRLDVLVNNAGYSEWKAIENITSEFLQDIMATNLFGAFWGCKAASKVMLAGGSIINISSIASKRGTAKNSAYAASKFAMNGLTQSLAKELGPRNIRINGVCPVLVSTPGLLDALKNGESPADGDSESFLSEFCRSQTALKRLPTSQDIADMCLFLSSEAAKAITGQNINVDCGVFPQ